MLVGFDANCGQSCVYFAPWGMVNGVFRSTGKERDLALNRSRKKVHDSCALVYYWSQGL